VRKVEIGGYGPVYLFEGVIERLESLGTRRIGGMEWTRVHVRWDESEARGSSSWDVERPPSDIDSAERVTVALSETRHVLAAGSPKLGILHHFSSFYADTAGLKDSSRPAVYFVLYLFLGMGGFFAVLLTDWWDWPAKLSGVAMLCLAAWCGLQMRRWSVRHVEARHERLKAKVAQQLYALVTK
jgi:hypothetical protein